MKHDFCDFVRENDRDEIQIVLLEWKQQLNE